MSEDITTIAAIVAAATDNDQWIEVPFEAIVRNATARQGKRPSKADLHDPNNERVFVKGAYFGGSFLDLQGSRIRIAGKGIKAKNYNGQCELSIGDKASVTVLGDAPKAGAPQGHTEAPAGRQAPPTPQRAPEDPTAHFHKEMKKTALLWLHSYQYMRDVSAKILNPELTPDLFQAGVSSLFIRATHIGLADRPPAPRASDGVGFQTYVAQKPKGPTPEEIEAEAKARAAAAAAEEERRHKEELARRAQANLDEDVPF